ncbi:DNA-directed RNA polymerase sigma-70 factor [Labrys miyagiensis]|uniref:DNA-directed RNA polymerase sigma-70 factor n=1 Tax=Labrys miyagiensis TaxID=346912 RepID=A0ABQ6CCZ1_9HYPH|nr:RNA polymerase sigma factor [Labrys miyagiensis]GLS18243.1 DNA-directed RNA polymerase sigma-70 factor [Labrys miyagiensis]
MDHGDLAPTKEANEAEIVIAAINGCTTSLTLLFERYRPRLYAAAVALLGYSGDAEDAVHDTFLTVLGRLHQLREPAAIGGWLHAILKNQCLMHRRRAWPQARLDEAARFLGQMSEAESIESTIQIRKLRDWVWTALQDLPEPQRATVILRYFSCCNSYEEMSAILGVPIGTIRSRLFEAKTRLSKVLLALADKHHDEHEVCLSNRQAFYREAFRELYRGRRDDFLAHYADDLQLIWSTGTRSVGRAHLDVEVDDDLHTGVRIAPLRIMASGNLTVIEGAFINPPESPDHCPPGCVLVMREGTFQVSRLHIHLAPRQMRYEE